MLQTRKNKKIYVIYDKALMQHKCDKWTSKIEPLTEKYFYFAAASYLGKGDADDYDDRNVLWLLFNFCRWSLGTTITQFENRQVLFAR